MSDDDAFHHAKREFERAKLELKELKRRMNYSKVARVHRQDIPEACSFCGQEKQKVETLIEGPDVYICNVCVRLCQDLLDAKGNRNEKGI